MKKMAMAIGLSACLLSLLLAAGVTQAKDLAKQAELLASCQKIQQYLTLPPEASAEQRALVALNIAIAQSQPLDESVDLAEVLRRASLFTTYLVMSDTFYLWSTDHWEGNHRTTYSYSGTRRTSEVEQTWDGANWVNYRKSTYAYDGNGRMSTMTDQTWASSAWVNQSLIVITYDGSGYMTQMLMQTWSGSVWVNYSRSTVTYSGGNIATVITEIWEMSAWVNSARTLYTYSDGHLTEWIMQSWVSSVWVNSSRGTLAYNGSGWETQSIVYTWQGDVWVNVSKYDYSYDGSGNETLALYSIAAGPSWVAMEADTSKWSAGKNTEIVHNHMIPPSVSRTQYTYDGNGNMTVDLGQDWSGSAWVNSDRGVYVYQTVGACGDFDASGGMDIADAVYLVNYIFNSGPIPIDARNGDIDCDSVVTIADAVYLVNYIFSGGAAPCDACP